MIPPSVVPYCDQLSALQLTELTASKSRVSKRWRYIYQVPGHLIWAMLWDHIQCIRLWT